MAETLQQRSTQSSDSIPTYDPSRAEDVSRRHQLLVELLRLKGCDGLLLQRPENIAWLSCGAEVQGQNPTEASAALFVNAEARVLLCNNVDSPQLFEGPFSGLGFQLKERPWEQPLDLLLQDLCRGRDVACDGCVPNCEPIPAELADFRQQFGDHEVSVLKELGRDVAHALEATARNCEFGETESKIAGHIAHRLMQHQATPVQIHVAGDGRRVRYRHWQHSDTPVRKFATLSAVARRQGLHVSASRTVCFGDAPRDLLDAHHHASMVLAIGMFFSKSGSTVGECWAKMARIYEKFGAPDEWRLSDQGQLTGYRPCELPVVPGGTSRFAVGNVVDWHPSVRSGSVGETILVQPDGFVHLTNSPNWPKLGIQVKGTEVLLPAILSRDATSEWCID